MKRIGWILLMLLLVQTILVLAAETTWYGPHLTDRSPWINKIILYNTGDTEAAATLTVWNEDGTVIHDMDVTIPALDQLTVLMTSDDGYMVSAYETQIAAVQGTFQVTTEDDTVVPLLSFQYGDNPSITQFFLSKETGIGYLLPNTGTDHFDWTGLAMAGAADMELTVTLKAVREGIVVGETTTDIPARGKLVATSDMLWSGLGIRDFEQVLVNANTPFPAPILITGNDTQDRHLFFSGAAIPVTASATTMSYPIVDTGQITCYNNSSVITAPPSGQAFHGQDAQYTGNTPGYADNGDGTVTDTVTGLMWQQDPGNKMTYDQAVAGESTFSLAGYDDWRLPTIKELYSLILFTGKDPSGYTGTDTSGLTPFIDDVFAFAYGDPADGDRIIDAQFVTTSLYTSSTMGGNPTMFGVNFADGRIKGYPYGMQPNGQTKTFFVLHVRGNLDYGVNQFVDNGDGTITDTATGLMWMTVDSGQLGAGDAMDGALNWEQALAFAENLDYAGYDDWRLPDAKELQSIVDYTRSPDATGSPAIDPLFDCTAIVNEGGQTDWPFYWSSTTHANDSPVPGGYGAYVSFGRALGYWNGAWEDVHGAGAQRSDPKNGDPADYPTGHGPQGDAIRIYNHVRCVRTAN